ncbi:MAG: alpha-L-glutamate ligase-like protein [Candidatus Competibacteraceae bacterium]|nr:MAG: alpha-L-glutamate ligase-like protein [Candidatus Competibacteraceae bacterium]
MFSPWRALKQAGVIGLNARNGRYILEYNDRRRYPLVDDKIRTKGLLSERGIAVPELLDVIRTQYEAGHLHSRLARWEQFVIKPASGSGGDGIVVIAGQRRDYWITASGRLLTLEDLQFHVSGILNGLYSLAGQPDAALIEALVHTDPILRTLAPEGVPDIRVVVFRGVPVMAMIRLPTRRSGGRANLHQGAIGAGIHLATGETLQAVMDQRVIDHHPDSDALISGFRIPDWDQLLELSAQCQEAVGLGYLGVDIVLDVRRGPLVLELNARPGLAIQIANRAGLGRRLEAVERQPDLESADLATRLAWSRELADL